MKKFVTYINSLAALLMAGAAFTACSDKDEIIGEQSVNPVTKYTMTVNASKGEDAQTRGLSLSGKTLSVKWAETDHVAVFPAASNSTLFGTLTATASETGTTTLTGDLTGSVHLNDNLNLLFPRGEWDYTGQKGILLSDGNSIEKKYDYALANVTVAAIDGDKITTTADANFASQQAIVKFILKDKANDADINASKLTISAASNKLVTKKILAAAGEKVYFTGYTVDAGSGGYGGYGHDKLVDGDLGSKWCANNGPWYIEFHTASAIPVNGYMLRTGDDTQSYSDRNPKSWVLKGKVNKDDPSWTVIDTKTNNTDLPAANNTAVDFTVDNPGTYQYFRLDISATGGDLMQLSEMQLTSNVTAPTEINAYGPIVVTPASATSEFTVALRNENVGADTYTLTAIVDGETYTLEKSGITFENGKYYEITAKLTEQTTIDLSTLTGDKTVKNGYTLTGTLNGAKKISIADGATVTLDGVTINGVHSDWYQYAGITCLGDATIILKDGTTNTVTGFDGAFPGIQGAAGKTLTITGTGSLYASCDVNGSGAGIGSASYSNNNPKRACGNIVIEGGTITAVGGYSGAGIGSGNTASCGNITIKSTVAHVTATKGSGAPNSIGAGSNGTCGTVTIEDGSKVTQN